MEIDLKGIRIKWLVGMVVDSPRYGEKVLVIDHVVLVGDIVGMQVAHKANRGGVLARKPQELPKSCARGPLWNFLAILELQIQDVSGAPKKFGTA